MGNASFNSLYSSIRCSVSVHDQQISIFWKIPEWRGCEDIRTTSSTGNHVPSLDEAILPAEQEAQHAIQEQQHAERLAAQLRAMGIEPES